MKTLLKRGQYTFDASAQMIEFLGVRPDLEWILLITNVTDQIVIYNPLSTSLGATLSNNRLTLEYVTTSMDDLDDLQIYIDIPVEKDYDDKNEILDNILTELKVISFLLSEGEDVDDIRESIKE